MKISVAMCTYNGEKYIRQQLDSIFAQTRVPDEIVICDDRSKDQTLQIAKEYTDRGAELRIYKNEKNLGFIENFKKCISLCSGELIFLCDQDDVWLKTKVADLQELMEENPEIMSVCTNFYLMDSAGKRFRREEGHGDNCFFNKCKWEIDWNREQLYKVTLLAIFSHNIAPGCTQVIRREIVDEFLCCDLQEPHDYTLNRTAALHNGLYYYDKPLTCYRVHETQTLGVPRYPIAKLKKDYAAMVKGYLCVFVELFYHFFCEKLNKVGMPPYFDYTDLIAYYDNCEMDANLRPQYEKWKKMATNRTILYQPGRGRWKNYIAQGKYNKYFAYNYALVERMQLRAGDLVVLLKRR